MHIASLLHKKVYIPSTSKRKDVKKLGRVKDIVFTSDGRYLVGLSVKRPDVAGMIAREDVFVAIDSIVLEDNTIQVLNNIDALGIKAIARLNLNYDKCIIWLGMDVVTENNTSLGQIVDIDVDPNTYLINNIYASESGFSETLLGALEIPEYMVIGLNNNHMLLDDRACGIEPMGGVAKASAEVVVGIKDTTTKQVEKIDQALDSKAHELGVMIKDTQQAYSKAAGVPIKSEDCENKKDKTTGDKFAYNVGKHLSQTKGMFSSFVDEYKKSSK